MFTRLIFEIIFSLIFKAIIPLRLRDKMTPWVFAWLLTWTAITPFVPVRYFFFGVFLFYLSISFLTDGYSLKMCGRNGVLCFFLMFWGWMLISMAFGEYSLICFSQYLIILFELIAVGYFVGMWAMRTPDGMKKLLRATAVCFSIVAFFYVSTGSLSPENMDANMRAGVNLEEVADGMDMKSNVNWIGLSMIGLLPYLYLCILSVRNSSSKHLKLIKLFAVVNAVILSVVLIRTGARNACLGLLPIAWYFLSDKTGGNRIKRIAIFAALVIGLGMIILITTSSISELRVFSYEKGMNLNEYSSGRVDWFLNYWDSSTATEHWFGSGAWYDIKEDGSIVLGNFHSMYMQIFRQSGFVGILLFVLFSTALLFRGLQIGMRGKIVIMFFGVWALTGIGEAQPILRGGNTKMLLGLAIAFCSRKFYLQQTVMNPYLQNGFDRLNGEEINEGKCWY